MKRWIPLAICGPLIAATTACSPEQVERWLEWHGQDPAAAEDWARNECGALCTDDWDRDGVVEPDGDDGTDGPQFEQYVNSQGSRWDRLDECESGGNSSINTGNGYYGGLQFLASTWRAYGGSGMPHQASRETQIAIAERVLDDVGWGAWPACSRRLGFR